MGSSGGRGGRDRGVGQGAGFELPHLRREQPPRGGDEEESFVVDELAGGAGEKRRRDRGPGYAPLLDEPE